ncbi:MAG: ester cyclase, partial [Geminicoccaceae bacterium]
MNATRVVSYKRQLYKGLYDLAASTPRNLKRGLGDIYHQGAHWRGSHPLNEIDGVDAIEASVWRPLLQSFPDLERRDQILVGGAYEGRDYVAAMGHYCGTFRKDWLTIPATGRPVYLRYGEVYQVEDGKVVESTCLWDLLDLIRQAGFWPIAPSLGTEGMWPGPVTAD